MQDKVTKNRRFIYDQMVQNDYDLEDFDSFSKQLDNEDARKELYDMLRSDDFNVGEYSDFANKIYAPITEPEKPFAQSRSVAPTPSEKPEEEKVQLSFTTPQKPQLQSLQVEQKEYPTIAETTQKKMAEGVAQRQQLSDMTTSVQRSLNRRGAELDEAQKANTQSYIPQGTAGSIPAFDAGRMYDPEYRDYAAAKESLQKAQAIIDAAGKEAEDKEKGHTGLGGFFKGAQRGFDESVIDWNTWTAGLKDTSEGLAILKALDAAEEGTLTESQQALLDAKAIEIATSQAYSSSLGRGYKAGQVTAESIPFMIEFALNPIARTGNTVAKKFARYALDRFGKEAAKKNVGKYVAGKALAKVATDALKAGAISATTGAGRTAADALQRMQGDIYYQPNEEGKVAFWKREGGEDATTAFKKAYANTTIENFSEMLGNYFAPIGKAAGVGVSKGLSKIGLEGVNQMLRDVKANDLAQLVADFEKRAQWNGTIGEFGEEVAGNILNSIIVGDQTLDTQEGTGVFNKENLIDTYLGVALLGGGLSAAKTIDYPLYKYYSQKDIKNAQLDFDDAFGKDEEVAKINEALTSDDPRIAGEALRNIIGNDTYTQDQQMSAAILAKTVQKYKGAKLFDEKMRNDPETPVEKVEVADSYDRGRNITTPQEKNDALNDLEAQEANIRQRYRLDPNADVYEFMGGDPIAYAMNETDTELRSEILDLVNAKAVYDGMTGGINERIATTIEESDRLIDSHVNKDDNLIHAAILKGVDENSDRKVYIISGAFARNEDGTIDTTDLAEGASMIVMDATSGKKEFIDPRNLKDVAEAINPAEEKQRAAETITNEIATKEEAEIAGTLAFVPNDIYTIADENGVEHTATIVADTQDGNVQVIIDNAQEPMLMQKEKVQQMADAYNIGRANAKIAEKKAQSTIAQSSSEVKPVIPMDEQGKPIYEQAPVEATWAELLSLNDGNAEEAIDTAKIMRDNAKKALDKANKAASAKGDTVEAIQQAKAERKALIDAAQAKYDYWDNVANYQASQPQEVVEPTTAEEQTPIVEDASFDENINEVEQVYNEESNERSTENTDVSTSVPAEDGIADGDQTSIEMVQGARTDNTLGDRGSIEVGQGSNESNVGDSVADVPSADVSGAEEVDNVYNGQEADISDEDIEALWIKSRDELWKPNDEIADILNEKLYEAHPEEHQPEDRKKVVRHLIEAAEKYKDHPIAKEVLKYVKYPQTTSMRVSPLTNREEMRRKPLRARAKMWEAKVGVPVHLIETFEEVPTKDARKAILDGKVVTAWVTDGEVYLYMPYLRNRTEVDKTYIHEVVAHVGMKRLLGKEGYRQFCMRVYNEVMTEADRNFYDAYPNVKDHAQAADEYIAHLSEDTDMESSIWQKVVRIFRDALRVLGIETALTNKDIQDLIRDSYKNLTNEENVADIDEESGQAMFSIRTYEEGGKKKLLSFLKNRVKDGAITQAESEDILKEMDQMYETAIKYKDKYAPFGAWSDAKVVENKDGKPAFSVIKKNDEYVMNLDFSTSCKKRRTLDAVYDSLLKRGLLEKLSLDGEQIVDINNIIRSYGFETACALCFVDAKRYRIGDIADKFSAFWNELVDMSDAKLKRVIKAEEKDSVRKKAAQHLISHPEDRIKVGRNNFISVEAFEDMELNRPAILSFYRQAQGSSIAKIPYRDVQYNSDIEGKKWNAEDAYAVGGVRVQSFSDYIPRLFFDYMQMFAALSARKMPVHAYTKEPIFAKQFGLTGAKINLSLVPDVVEGGVAAGLDADGNYAWKKGETFPYDEAIALQNAEGYRENCGTIAVGVSDAHIEKMLDDPNIRMVIPYHKSGINPLVAAKNKIDAFEDYTSVQGTRDAKGTKLTKEAIKKYNMPNFNALMHEGMDARQAAQAYLDWCDENGFLPKFDKFRNHPNYYKLLEDFTTIVPDANGVETIYPQGAVSMTFPTEEDAFGSIESLIREGLEEDAILEGRRDENVEKIVDTIEEELVNFRFIGEVGASNLDKAEEATTRLDNLAIAREMEAADKSAKTIKMATGWERGADGKWRYEVDDNITAKMIRGLKGAGLKKIHEARSKHIKDLDKYAYITNVVGIDRLYDDKDILATTWPDAQKKNWLDIYNIYKDNREAAIEDYKKARTQITRLTSFGKGEFMLYEVLGEDHSLFKEYPQLKQVKLFVKPYKGSAHMGGYNRLSNTIDIVDYRGVFENDKGEGTANTLVHEIQHVIQGIEGFARGGNMSMEDTRKVKTKEAEVAYYTEMYEDAVKERRDLADQARLLNEKMYTWWNEHPDSTWEEALRESDMYEWNKAYDALQGKIKEAQDRVEQYERNLEEVENMDTSLGLEGYKRLSGEVEARNVERRRNMSLGERRNSPAWVTEDVSRKDQIFIEDALSEANAQFRISNYDRQFADLQSEYDALDKNDEKALNEWRDKKVDVVESYLYGVADNFGMKPEIAIFNGADEQQMREAYGRLEEAFRKNGATPPSYEAFKEHALDKDVFATYYRGGDIITNNLSTIDYINDKMRYAANLFHEVAHHHAHVLYNAKELKEIWDDVKGSNLPLVEKLNTARLYKDKSDASKGNEFIAHSIGALVREYKPLFQQFLRGENNVTADDVVKKLNYKKTKANFAVAEILNRIKDEYQESRSRVGGNISEGIGGGRPNRVPRRVLQGDVPEQNGGRRVRERGGRLVLDSLLNDVAQRGLREMVGEDAYNAFLMRAVRDLDESTRRAIMENGMRNGLNFHDAAEEYLASLAEQDNVDEAYLSKVNALVKGMLQNAGIEVGDISNNELRYMLWRSHLQYDGVFSLAEDVVMRNKLGVGNYTQEADTSFRVADITYGNFYDYTKATFNEVEKPAREADYTSNSGSQYWYGEDKNGQYVVRGSNHWSGIGRDQEDLDRGRTFAERNGRNTLIGSCQWELISNKTSKELRDSYPNPIYGKVYLKDMKPRFDNNQTDAPSNEREQIIADAKADGTYLKAPNGKDTNLTPDQWVTVRTDAFKKWFGDWENDPANASQIVDANGEPKVVYHRTPNKFTSFDVEKIGSSSDFGAFGNGFYFSPYVEQYRLYGKYKIAAYLNARNPFNLNEENVYDTKMAFGMSPEGQRGWTRTVSKEFTQWLKDNGYDAVVYKTDYNEEEDVVFNPNQIKSAKGNTTFDANNDDIRFRVAPSTPSTTIVKGEAKGVRESFDDMVRRASYQMKEAGYDRYQSIKEFMCMASKAHGVNLKNGDVKEIVSYENPYIALLNKSSINEKEVKAWEKKYYIPIIDAIQRIYKDSKGKIAQLQQDFGSESMDDILNNYTQGKHGLERNRDMAVRKSLDNMAKATVITKQEAEDMLETVNADLRNDVITPTQADARRQQINNMLTTKKYDEKMVKHQTERWDEIKDEIRKNDKLTWEQKQRALDKAAITEFGVDLAERDYSGLGKVFPNKGGKLQESIEAAYKAVEAFEETFDTADLWKAIKAANDATLEKAFMSSIINRETYNNIRNMYDYYIPLRGFEADTTEDVYGYLNNEPKAFSMPVKRANGRASKAEFAIPHILQMAHSAILQGNNNLAKLTMANFAQHYPSDLVKQSNMWIEYDETSKTWVAKYPDIPKDASVEDVSRIVDDFNANMEELAKDNPKKYRKVKGKMDVPYIVPKDKVHYHQIPYKRNGVDYILTVSGSPRLAFVMNGEIDKAPSVMGEVGEKVEGITRFLSGMYTQYNPDFMVSNFFRDGSFVLSTIPVREDAKYAANYYKNYFLNNPLVMTRLFNKYEAGTLNRDNYIEAAFEDFLKHGGETGYAILRDVEETKKKVKKDIHYGLWNKAKALIDRLGIVGRGVESSARFAAYLTSREAGRSIARSVYDAKEVSVNFNRKGAGAVFNNLADQNFWGKMVGNTAGVFKITHAFFNAGVQGLAGVSKLVKHNPVKGGMWLASPFLLGVLIASLYDDDDEYYNLTETVRRQNIMIRMGDDYVSIPLAIELRALYGIGEMMVSLSRGKEDLTQKDVAYKIAEQILQAFPINVLEGNGGFDALMPTAYAMVQELMVNEDWQGIPIYREDKYAGEEYKPEWRMVNNYTDERLVAASKFLSKATGGNYGKRGGIEINPAVVQHIMEGMFGGPVSFANKVLAQYDVLVGNKEFEWRNVPFLNRLVKDGGGKAQERMLNREYRNNEERYEQIHSQEVDYQKFIKDASNSEEERAEYQQMLDELRASEEYKMLNDFHKQSLNIDKMYKAYKDQGILDEQMPTILEQKEIANAPLRQDK